MEDKLYLLGNQECLNQPRICVVGSRRMSAYGERQTKLMVRALVKSGWVIVSGMARGIDRVAHETALEYGGKTIAVLAHGLDECYPPEHKNLKQRIVENGGLLVSSYAQGVRVEKDHFRERNYLMVKLSQAVLVVEAERKSGTKITVGFAGEMGKNVYVVPGPINQSSYHGSVEIIRDGGIPIYSSDDLLEMLKYIT